VLTSQAGDAATRLHQFDEAIEPLRREHAQHTRYVSDNEHELGQLPTIERAVETRLEQLVEADVNDPPAYLRSLGPVPHDNQGLARWRTATHFVERDRVERGITDPQRPFGPRPDTAHAAVWRVVNQRLSDLIVDVNPPNPSLERGIELT
jgi:hypothetical protein